MINTDQLHQMSNALRFLSIDAVEKAKSGHPGMPMGMADVVTVLYKYFLEYNPQDPTWLGRDRFILSNGHGSMLQYALLHLTDYGLSIEDIKNFRQLHSPTAGHPELGEAAGIETTTGPLGQGLANAVGMAIAAKMSKTRFGNELFNHKIYVSVGDGCLMEGLSHEVCELAGHLNLSNLVVLFDDNNICIDGEVTNTSSTHHKQRFESYGFKVIEANGHDYEEIYKSLEQAQTGTRPHIIFFKTHIGFGSPSKQDSSGAHGSPLGEEEVSLVRERLHWPHEPFNIPAKIKTLWLEAAENGRRNYTIWQDAFNQSTSKNNIINFFAKTDYANAINELSIFSKETLDTKTTVATRKASGNCIDVMTPVLSNIVSGSADLTGSVNTFAKGSMKAITPDDFSGNYIHYGVREHAMGSIMNGLALYGGYLPTGGTFLTFTDYMREPIRLSAMMNQQVIYVMTHDSIGLGEDGPTHQPVEHLAMLRATPNLNVFRPADQNETTSCWALALEHKETPSVMVLSRQNLPPISHSTVDNNLCAKGAYIAKSAQDENIDELDAIILATGSELSIAQEAQVLLALDNIACRVVSMPCWELFDKQDSDYKNYILPPQLSTRIAIEAASEMGWHKYIGSQGTFIGMESFGASAPASELYHHFGITANAVVHKIKELLNNEGVMASNGDLGNN